MPAKKPRILLYGTQVCPWCHKTREFLRKHKTPFKNIDVGSDAKSAEEMIQKSGQQGVPVIDINGEIIIGFDEERLRKVLKI